MLKVLIYQNVLPHYRVPIFDELGKHVDLTIMCDTNQICKGKNFKTMLVHKSKFRIPHVGVFHDGNFRNLVQQSDVLISMLTTGYLDIDYMKLYAPKTKHIRWGIGVNASYNVRYDSGSCDKLLKLINSADAALFYSDYPRQKYIGMSVNQKKLFVANNTVRVEELETTEKDCILFVGSLYKQKRVDILLKQYKKAAEFVNAIPNLLIVGDGDERDNLIRISRELEIEGKVNFAGQIIEEKELSKCFARAYACISPDQAGLSVLKSMGYGVPFVTLKNAITGGEIFNIQNGHNGVLVDLDDGFEKVLIDIARNSTKYLKYGERARQFYAKNRMPEQMVNGFLEAINYVMR